MRKIIVKLLIFLVLINVSTGNALSADGTTDLRLPDIESAAAVLIDATTGQVLYHKDMDKRMYPASITKILTALLAMKYGTLSDTLTISDKAVLSIERDSSNIALDIGEQITLQQALYALTVASANDAANGIAEFIGGTVDGFVDMMNSEAKELGAVNTHFTNANGLPDDDHYTTAYDMALITAAAIKIPGLIEIFNTKRYIIPPTNKQPETRILNSSNRFTNGDISYEGTLMSKAGWTVDAQHTLVTAARRDGTTLIAVVMKSLASTAKWSDTVDLLDYGFDQFNAVAVSKDDILQAAQNKLIFQSVEDSEIDPNTYNTQDVSVLLPKGYALEDIQFSFGDLTFSADKRQVNIPVCMNFTSPDATYVPEEIANTTIQASFRPGSEAIDVGSGKLKEQSSVFRIIFTTFLWIIGVLLFLYVFLVIRRAVIIRKRKLRRRQANRRMKR